ncbi:MAG: dihydroxyacetone kinase subunit L [Pseudonocardiales bacterium]|nr:dihydroxyacetone kinase subunit L [Pseudonocardiales bacterium]MBV9030245.1 dihydroxyacetone kinase subunit L [Pseudonocardiales bacterium]MBW0009616.1 dihydroxyacetone kinase subunit L [Pseudonocardiales bacterium]
MGQTVDAASLTRWVREFRRAVAANRDLLTRLDSAIGDADHGINMDRGLAVVVAELERHPPSHVSVLLRDVGTTLMSAVGGASGALYGTFFLRMATAAGQQRSLEGPAFAQALRAGLEGVRRRGKAVAGDKTMVDALAPAVDALDVALAGGAGLGAALRGAALAARAGRDATTPMLARRGRASFLGERSVGHQDPGATSAALLIAAAATAFADVPG